MGLRKMTAGGGASVMYFFHCPGCNYGHAFRTKGKGPCWEFNGDMDCPTFKPSLLVHRSEVFPRCHLFLRNGRLEFLGDCEHHLAGKTVDLPPNP